MAVELADPEESLDFVRESIEVPGLLGFLLEHMDVVHLKEHRKLPVTVDVSLPLHL